MVHTQYVFAFLHICNAYHNPIKIQAHSLSLFPQEDIKSKSSNMADSL